MPAKQTISMVYTLGIPQSSQILGSVFFFHALQPERESIHYWDSGYSKLMIIEDIFLWMTICYMELPGRYIIHGMYSNIYM